MDQVDAYRYRDAIRQTIKNKYTKIEGYTWQQKRIKTASKTVRNKLIPQMEEELEFVEDQIAEAESV